MLCPQVARLTEDGLQFAEVPRDVVILDEAGEPLKGRDHARRFFEASWLHKHGELYYFSYSTGDTHYLCYATGTSPYGPFTYRGRLLEPVQGWTTHHSVVEHEGRWFLFYHDTELSGRTHLRSAKATEIRHRPDGTIETVNPFLS